MARDYQYNYSQTEPNVFETEGRERKTRTTVAVLKDYFQGDVADLTLLDVGGSTGIIDNELAKHVGR